MRRGRGKGSANEPVTWPGEAGFLLLAYTGNSPNRRKWKGPATGIHYYFGPGDVRWVDRLDGLKFLTPRGGGKAFRSYRD